MNWSWGLREITEEQSRGIKVKYKRRSSAMSRFGGNEGGAEFGD